MSRPARLSCRCDGQTWCSPRRVNYSLAVIFPISCVGVLWMKFRFSALSRTPEVPTNTRHSPPMQESHHGQHLVTQSLIAKHGSRDRESAQVFGKPEGRRFGRVA